MSKCYCCINFWHFKLKVVILICLEVAQSEVVISNTTTHTLDASAAHKFAALTPSSVKLRLHGQVGSGQGSGVRCKPSQVQLARKHGEHGEYPASARIAPVFTVLRLASARSWFYLLPPELSPTSRLPVAINRKNTAQRESRGSRGSCQNTNEILN